MEVQGSYMYTHLASSLTVYLEKVSGRYPSTIYQVHNHASNMRLIRNDAICDQPLMTWYAL